MIRHTFAHRHFAFSFELHYLLLLLSSALSLRRCCAIVTVLTHRANGGAGHCYPMEVQTTATPLTSFSSGLQCIDSSTLPNPLYPLPGFEDWRGTTFFWRASIFFLRCSNTLQHKPPVCLAATSSRVGVPRPPHLLFGYCYRVLTHQAYR